MIAEEKSNIRVINCYHCGSDIPVPVENDKSPGCIRCLVCGQKTCSE